VHFAEACEAAGLKFIGPTPANIREFGLKHTARELAQGSGVALLPGTGLLADGDQAVTEARQVGYPVILKSTAGGGGIGMRICTDEKEVRDAFQSVQRLSQSHFGSGGIYLEKFIVSARHVEVQIFGDGQGNAIALGERDCSAQRRNQKVIEETPAPGLSNQTRRSLHETAECRADVLVPVWEKLAWNAGFNAVTTLTDTTVGEVLDRPATRALVVAAMEEVDTVATALGIPVRRGRLAAVLDDSRRGLRDFATSMLQDRRRGRRLEWDAIGGAVLRAAGRTGVPVPVNRTLCGLLAGLDARD
jgi:ketopantoate reductase